MLRVSNEGLLERVPTERTYTELNDGEFLSGILNLKVTYVEPVKLEGISPGSAGDAGHFKVDGDEIGGSDMVAERVKSEVEVRFCHVLKRKRRRCLHRRCR